MSTLSEANKDYALIFEFFETFDILESFYFSFSSFVRSKMDEVLVPGCLDFLLSTAYFMYSVALFVMLWEKTCIILATGKSFLIFRL